MAFEVDVQSITVRLGGVMILKDVSLHLTGPCLIGLVGPSGSGKTTLLGAIGGGTPVTSGVVDRGSLPRPAWVFQTSPLIAYRSALDNAALGPMSRGVEREESVSRAREGLARVGIGHLASRQARRLSGGEQQRVGIARAIATPTQLILADEPTASLDLGTRLSVVDALRAAAQTALVVVATHDAHVAEACDSVHEMERLTEPTADG